MNDTAQLVTKGERHCGTNLLTEVLKLTFGGAACPGSGRFIESVGADRAGHRRDVLRGGRR